MIRNVALAVGVLALTIIGIRLGQDDGGPVGGCDGVRQAHERVAEVEGGTEVPTSSVYTDVAQDVRRGATAAPSDVSPHLHALADSYGHLAALFQGFDPGDPGTYGIVEERTPAIEREEARVDEASDRVAAWLQRSCDG